MSEIEKLYRPNVAAIIVSSRYPSVCEIFIAERNDIKDVWQFPQGGIDEGETSTEALFRELEEEIGTKDVDIVHEYPDWMQYDFPDRIAKKMHPYSGQKQRYYLVKLKPGAKINLDTEHPEFKDHKFINYKEVMDYVTYFKRPIYQKVLSFFREEGYL